MRKATKAVAELFASDSCTTPKLKWIFVTLCPPPLRFDQSHKMQSLFYCLPFLVGVTEVNLYINKFLKNAIMCSEMLNNLQASYVSYSWGFVTAIAAHSKIRNSFSASLNRVKSRVVRFLGCLASAIQKAQQQKIRSKEIFIIKRKQRKTLNGWTHRVFLNIFESLLSFATHKIASFPKIPPALAPALRWKFISSFSRVMGYLIWRLWRDFRELLRYLGEN